MRTRRYVATLHTAVVLAIGLSGAVAPASHAAAVHRSDDPPVAPVDDHAVDDTAPLVSASATGAGDGYWEFLDDGTVIPFGHAVDAGDAHTLALHAPIIDGARTADSRGYWLLGDDGGVFSFGDARFYGSVTGLHLNEPLIAMAATPSGGGYWLLAQDGGVFSFGDARFYGSVANLQLNQPLIAMSPTPSGHGYWLLGKDGGVFSFGDARFYGSIANLDLNAPIIGLTPTPTGHGYWLLAADGGVFSFGDAEFHGSIATMIPGAARRLVSDPTGNGYWLFTGRGAVVAYGDAATLGTVVHPAPNTQPPTVMYFGDSLLTQAEADVHFMSGFIHVDTSTASFPGTALCDFIDHITRAAVALHPDAAVLAFSGNAFTPCMHGPGGGSLSEDGVVQRYRAAANVVIALLAAEGVEAVFAGGPPMFGTSGESAVNQLYMDLAAQHPLAVAFTDAGASVAGPGRSWSKRLPCLPFETAAFGCRGGQIVVRSPDTVHFCPDPDPASVNDWRMPCPMWSSGAWRFATGLVFGAQRALDGPPIGSARRLRA